VPTKTAKSSHELNPVASTIESTLVVQNRNYSRLLLAFVPSGFEPSGVQHCRASSARCLATTSSPCPRHQCFGAVVPMSVSRVVALCSTDRFTNLGPLRIPSFSRPCDARRFAFTLHLGRVCIAAEVLTRLGGHRQMGRARSQPWSRKERAYRRAHAPSSAIFVVIRTSSRVPRRRKPRVRT